jgi:hypothetical protein
VGDVAALREQEPAIRLVEALNVLGQSVSGEAAMQRRAVHHFVRQAVQLARPEGAPEHHAAGRPSIDAPGDVEEPLARQRLQLAPQLVRPPEKRDVGRMFPVGEPDDAGEPVRGAVLVDQVEALQSQHPKAPAREVIERGAPHAAEAEDDDVVCGHGPSSPS